MVGRTQPSEKVEFKRAHQEEEKKKRRRRRILWVEATVHIATFPRHV